MNYPLVRPKFYFSLFKEISIFIKNPDNKSNVEKSTSIKIYKTIGLYVLKLILLIPVILFFALVYDPKNVQSISMSERFSPIVFLILGGIILPFVEEIGFRLSLKFKPLYLALSASVFMYYFLTKIFYQTKISLVDESFSSRILIAVFFGLLVFPLINIKSIRESLALFWSLHFRTIFYLSGVVFAWMHITKYEINTTNLLLLPILTLPQLFSAIIYGYARVRFGFIYPLMLHICMNMITIGVSFLPFSDILS